MSPFHLQRLGLRRLSGEAWLPFNGELDYDYIHTADTVSSITTEYQASSVRLLHIRKTSSQ